MCTGGTMALNFAQGAMNQMGIAQEADASAADYLANREIARSAQADAVARGATAAGNQRQKVTQLLESQKVALGASGVDGTVGTPVDVAGSSAAMGELDARTIENNAAREAWGYQQTVRKLDRQQAVDESQRMSKSIGSLLGTLGAGASTYASMSKGSSGSGSSGGGQ